MTKQKTELQNLLSKAETLAKRIKEFEEEHDDVLGEHTELKSEMEGLTERLKIEARKEVEGWKEGSKKLADNQYIEVYVAAFSTREIDPFDLRKTFGKKADTAIEEVVKLKELDALVSNGELDEKKLKKITKTVVGTPRVTIKFP